MCDSQHPITFIALTNKRHDNNLAPLRIPVHRIAFYVGRQDGGSDVYNVDGVRFVVTESVEQIDAMMW